MNFATAAGVLKRPKAWSARISAFRGSDTVCVICVSMNPGKMALNRIFDGPCLAARSATNPSKAAFDAA